MKTQLICSTVMGIMACGATAETAVNPSGDGSARGAELLREGKPIALNRLSLSYRLGLNITADFRKLGGFARMTDPGPDTGALVDRIYDNGYNSVDITGNNHQPGFPDTTWNWGFQGGGAVQGSSLVLQAVFVLLAGDHKLDQGGLFEAVTVNGNGINADHCPGLFLG